MNGVLDHSASQTFFNLDSLTKFISSKDLVFDIGANIGGRTAVFAQLARKVVAVEPVTASFLKLTEHANEKVFPLHCALSDYHGSGFIHTCAAAPTIGVASLSVPWIKAVTKSGRLPSTHWDTVSQVGVTTFDRVIEDHEFQPL